MRKTEIIYVVMEMEYNLFQEIEWVKIQMIEEELEKRIENLGVRKISCRNNKTECEHYLSIFKDVCYEVLTEEEFNKVIL